MHESTPLNEDGAAMEMTGSSMTEAPSARSRSVSPLAWARVRVTATVVPASGPGSYQANRSRRAATAPTTMMAGALNPTAAARSAMVANVPASTSCMGVVPQRTRETGVSAERPDSISRRAMTGRLRTPM